MHNREDETIAIDAKCPDTVEMFSTPFCKIYAVIDKSIADDFPKQIDQRNNPEE